MIVIDSAVSDSFGYNRYWLGCLRQHRTQSYLTRLSPATSGTVLTSPDCDHIDPNKTLKSRSLHIHLEIESSNLKWWYSPLSITGVNNITLYYTVFVWHECPNCSSAKLYNLSSLNGYRKGLIFAKIIFVLTTRHVYVLNRQLFHRKEMLTSSRAITLESLVRFRK